MPRRDPNGKTATVQKASDAAAEKPGSAKYRDNLPRHETNICGRRALSDRISAGLAGSPCIHPAGNEVDDRGQPADIR